MDLSSPEPVQITKPQNLSGSSTAHHVRAKPAFIYPAPTNFNSVPLPKGSGPLTSPPQTTSPLSLPPSIQTNLCSHGEPLTLCSKSHEIEVNGVRSPAISPVLDSSSTSKGIIFCTNCGKERTPGISLCAHCNVKFEDYSGLSSIETGTQTPRGGKVSELWANPPRPVSPRSSLRSTPFRTVPPASTSSSATPTASTTPSSSLSARLAFFASGRK